MNHGTPPTSQLTVTMPCSGVVSATWPATICYPDLTTVTRITPPQSRIFGTGTGPEREDAPTREGGGREAWVDRLRGLAILLMVGDHYAAMTASQPLLRHTLFRLSLPFFMVSAAVVWRGAPSSLRLRQLALAVVGELVLSTMILRLDGPGPVVLFALVLAVAPVASRYPACVAVLGIVQTLYLPVPWAGYQPGLLVAYWCLGRLARDEFAGMSRLPRWLEGVGRRPLTWYVAHLAALVILTRTGLL